MITLAHSVNERHLQAWDLFHDDRYVGEVVERRMGKRRPGRKFTATSRSGAKASGPTAVEAVVNLGDALGHDYRQHSWRTIPYQPTAHRSNTK